MGWITGSFVTFIFILAGCHLVAFLFLMGKARRTREKLRVFLQNCIKRPIADRAENEGLEAEIDRFIYDIGEVMETPSLSDHRQHLLNQVKGRIDSKDEAMPYARQSGFEVLRSVSDSLVEAYPLIGIMGTIFAMAHALRAAPMTAEVAFRVGDIVQEFQLAIDTTLFGLIFGVLYAVVRAWQSPGFDHLAEQKGQVRSLIERAKRELQISAESGE